MEWFNVTCDRFDAERRRAVFASFVLQSANRDTAVQDLESYLLSETEGTVACEWKPKTIQVMLGIPEQGITRVQQLGQAVASYYDKVPGDQTRLIEYREFEPSD